LGKQLRWARSGLLRAVFLDMESVEGSPAYMSPWISVSIASHSWTWQYMVGADVSTPVHLEGRAPSPFWRPRLLWAERDIVAYNGRAHRPVLSVAAVIMCASAVCVGWHGTLFTLGQRERQSRQACDTRCQGRSPGHTMRLFLLLRLRLRTGRAALSSGGRSMADGHTYSSGYNLPVCQRCKYVECACIL